MSIDNTEDLIDSRDVLDRLAEMEGEAVSRYANGREDLSYGEIADVDPTEWLDEEDADEYRALRALADDGEANASDWEHGATLIRDSYFEDYARELAEDIGAIDPDASWPLSYIDWERAADALKMDYTELDFDGATYWVRS